MCQFSQEQYKVDLTTSGSRAGFVQSICACTFENFIYKVYRQRLFFDSKAYSSVQ